MKKKRVRVETKAAPRNKKMRGKFYGGLDVSKCFDDTSTRNQHQDPSDAARLRKKAQARRQRRHLAARQRVEDAVEKSRESTSLPRDTSANVDSGADPQTINIDETQRT